MEGIGNTTERTRMVDGNEGIVSRDWRKESKLPEERKSGFHSVETRSLDLSRVHRHNQKRSDRQTGRQAGIFQMTLELAASTTQCVLFCSKV